MAAVRKVCRITMDTSVEPAMSVHGQDGSIMKLKDFRSGLYYYDAGIHSQQYKTNSTTQDLSFVNKFRFLLLNTVAENKTLFTMREVKATDNARTLYRKLGHPSEKGNTSTSLKAILF